MNEVKVEVTKDYSKFKFLEENREITEQRVKKILDSISDVGYVINPILVNEKMEIIDGQGRFMALKRLGLPQYYIMQAGLGVEECRRMNLNQTNWTMMDYINSYAKSGSADYLRLKDLIATHSLKPYHVITMISGKNGSIIGGNNRNLIMNGKFELPHEEYEKMKWILDYAEHFKDVAKQIGGKQDHFFIAIRYAYEHLTTPQRNCLEDVIKKNVSFIPSLTHVADYLKVFDSLYNRGKRKPSRISLEVNWRLEDM